MNEEDITKSTDQNDRVCNVHIEDEMKNCYIDYAMSVIIGRALPDVRDGLKPVHRRILYAMNDLGMTPDKPFRKSARIVGEVLGKYHPHGDASVYDAMVRMAQDFSTRYMTVQGQGNFGSVDGDGAAAMRYTEARLSKISLEMMRDINKETVDFMDNFDGSEQEPVVLPAKFPHLLVNGSQGIAVGMATNIPPHNLGDVVDATVALIDDPEVSINTLIDKIQGPDFPTGGIIMGKGGLRSAYKTGRGRIKIRSRIDVHENKRGRKQIIVSEIPYMVNKAKLIEKIAELVKNRTVEGISDIRDESDLKKGIHIVIDLKRDANETVILNQLCKHTQLQDTFGVIMLALVKGEPKVLNLRELLTCYLDHQKEVITRRTIFDLKKAEARAHILEGLRIALDHIDEVINLIRASKDGKEAKAGLMERFGLTEIQAQAILDMRLQRLTGLERDKIEEEYAQLLETIDTLRGILADESKVLAIIREELLEIKDKYADARRTTFEDDADDFEIEDLIEEEDVVVTMTHVGYIKRIPADTYKAQRRGGKGITALSTRENDFVEHLYTVNTHDNLMFFTTKGRVLRLKGYEIPEGSRTAKGTPIVNLLTLEHGEKIATVIPVKDFAKDKFLMMVTKNGLIKKTPLSEYDTNRKNGIIAIILKEEDELIGVRIIDAGTDVILGTRKGLAIRFDTDCIRPVGRGAIGVRGMSLKDDDVIVGMDLIKEGMKVLAITEKGYGKTTLSTEYRTQGRGGKGYMTYMISPKTGEMVGFCTIEDEDIMLINSQGIIIKTASSDISTFGRAAMGVKVMKLAEGERIVTICKTAKEEETETIEKPQAQHFSENE